MPRTKGQINVGFLLLLPFICAVSLLYFFHIPVAQPLLVILAVFIFIISFLNPDLALIILILSMLLSPEISAGGIGGRSVVVRSEDIFVLVVSLGWVARLAVNKELAVFRWTALNAPIMTYFVICLVSSGLGILQGLISPQQSFFYLTKYFEYFLLFFMVSNSLTDRAQVKRFVFFLLLTCCIVCVYGMAAGGERLSAPFEGEGGEPNTFAAYLILMMSMVIGLMLYAGSVAQGVTLFALLCLSAVVFVLTLSRGGWLSSVPMLLVFLFVNRRYRHFLILFLCAAALLLPVLIPEKVHERVQSTFAHEKEYTLFGKTFYVSESAAARLDSWKIGFTRWASRPLFGYGVPSGNVIDNQYIRVLTDTGTAGILAFLWLIASLFRVGWRTYTASADGFIKGLSLGYLAALPGLLIHGFSAATFILIRVMEPFWFLTAIIVMLPELPERRKEEGSDAESI